MMITEEQHAARCILCMLAELHVRGYERLRICPEYFPHGDGSNWNCSIVPADETFALHGARAAKPSPSQYTSDMQRRYFGWVKVEQLTPSQLADRFLSSFPELARHGCGADWPYASWYALLLRLTFPAALPVAAHPTIDTDRWLHAERGAAPPALIPLPPSGGVLALQSTVSDAASFVGEREAVRFPRRTPACPTSFEKPLPMPEQRTLLRYARWLPNEYYSAMSFGFVPQGMDDKWFAYVRDDRLYMHRSWTGYCLYEIRFERIPEWLGGGYLASEAVANRNPQQHDAADDLEDARLLDRLVYNLCCVNAGLPEF
jgi:hypothetical protein